MPAADRTFIPLADLVRSRPFTPAAPPPLDPLESARQLAGRAPVVPVPSESSLTASPLLVALPDDAGFSPDFTESAASSCDAEMTADELAPPSSAPPLAHVTLAPPLAVEGSAAALRDARLFRAAVADLLDARIADFLKQFAAEVLARELQLAPADVAVLAQQLIAQYRADEPICVRVAPGDGDVRCDLPVIVDPMLQSGDAVLECRSGGIDARLDVRLAQVLAGLLP